MSERAPLFVYHFPLRGHQYRPAQKHILHYHRFCFRRFFMVFLIWNGHWKLFSRKKLNEINWSLFTSWIVIEEKRVRRCSRKIVREKSDGWRGTTEWLRKKRTETERSKSEQWHKEYLDYTLEVSELWVRVCVCIEMLSEYQFLLNKISLFFSFIPQRFMHTYTTYLCRTLSPTQRHTQTSSMNKPKFFPFA